MLAHAQIYFLDYDPIRLNLSAAEVCLTVTVAAALVIGILIWGRIILTFFNTLIVFIERTAITLIKPETLHQSLISVTTLGVARCSES